MWYQKYNSEETLHNKWHILSSGNCVMNFSDLLYLYFEYLEK